MTRRTSILFAGFAAAIGAVWVLYAAGTGLVLDHTAPLQRALVRASGGKVTDGAAMLRLMLRDTCMLATWALGLAGLWTVWFIPATARIASHLRRVAARTALLFALINVFAAAGANRLPYWMAMWDHPPHIYTQFNIKRLLRQLETAPTSAVILGSSQAMAQIGEETLNRELGPGLAATELHFSGALAFDLALIQPTLRDRPPDLYLVYLNENNLYAFHEDRLMYFLNPQGLVDLLRLRGPEILADRSVWYGALSMAFPLIRQRDVLTRRILGPDWVLLKGGDRQDTLDALDPGARADRLLETFSLAHGPVNRRMFETFVDRAARDGSRVVLCRGTSHPALVERMPADMTREFEAWIEALAASHPNLVILRQEDLLVQTADDYVDLTHVNKAARERYTLALANALRRIIHVRE